MAAPVVKAVLVPKAWPGHSCAVRGPPLGLLSQRASDRFPVTSDRPAVICPSCGTPNPGGAKFCIECATRLGAPACPGCGVTNPASARFCGECATPLSPGATPAAALATSASAADPFAQGPIAAPAASTGGRPGGTGAQPLAERRLVSILFADLVGFTSLAEGRDAEETRDLLTRYFDLASDVIGRYGGSVEKFIGDAVMAVWGAPVAHEDDAERAVRAALDLVDAVRGLAPELAARAGVLTGEAAVTLGATNQGMVAGDLVNTASRLQSVAPSGAVLVGESTQRAASAAIVFDAAGDQLLKGRAAPVPAWRALRVVAEVGGRGRSDVLEAPFVGREDELRLLKDLYHATARERRVRLVSVIGPGGIGKSRLAWEFLKYLDGLVDDVWWHQGRSPAHGGGLPFWALGEMVRGRCGLRETEDERTTRQKLTATLATHVPVDEERRWLEPALLALLGVGAPAARSDDLFAAWRTFFERLAASDPVVMAFEDLHWADPGTLDFIDHLLEWSRGLPIYVVTLARPELLERRGDWGAGKRNFTSLTLEPLREPAMRELLAGLVGDLPESAARAIVARADGIPLYAVETVRMLVAEGRLELREGRYLPAGDLTSLAVPETLTALIAARLDALDGDDRALVQDAAVLGQSFSISGLEAVSGQPAAGLEPRLRGLVRRELLRLEVDPRSPERGQYAFVQALIREVAYNTLAKRERKIRHLAAARHFEALGGDELAGALAAHLLAAWANAGDGPEADALAIQARLALVAAADRAGALGGHDQALGLLRQALTVTSDTEEEARLLLRAGRAASYAGRDEDAEPLLVLAVERSRAIGDRRGAALASAELGRAIARAQHVERALDLLVTAGAEFADLLPDPAALELHVALAASYGRLDRASEALTTVEQVLEAAEHADLVETVVEALVTKGSTLCGLGRQYEGLALLDAAARLGEANGLQALALLAHSNRAAFLVEEPRLALEAERAAMMLAHRLGRMHFVTTNVQNAGEDALRVGEWDWAIEQLESLTSDQLSPASRVTQLNSMLMFAALRGQDVSAIANEIEALLAEQSGRMFDQTRDEMRAFTAFSDGDHETAAEAWRAIARMSALNAPIAFPRAARAALWARDRDGAKSDLEAFIATGAHGRASRASRLTIEAGLAALDASVADAIAAYRDALRGWGDLGLPWDEALTGLDMALLLGPAEPDVGRASERARDIFVQLGARPFLERLEAAMARRGAVRSTA
jgi:class 3 adenylate cyclase/tetratricopeptide (TPR) repeat protein